MKIDLLASAQSGHTWKIARALQARGMQVRILSLHPAIPDQAPGIPVLRLPYEGKIGYLRNIFWLRGEMKRHTPDLVHVHYASGYGTLAALGGVRPYILTCWGSDIYLFPRRSPLHRALVAFNLRRAAHCVVPSQDMRRAQKAVADVPADIIPFGIDTAVFHPFDADPSARTPFTRDDFIIGICKAFYPIYGHRMMLDALKILIERHGHRRPRLVLVGDSAERAAIAARAAAMGLGPYVHFAGHAAQDDMPRYHNIFSCYAVPSQSESLCVSAIEASACGKPVVATRVGGLPEVVADGRTGILVPPEDAASFAAAIARLMDDPALARTMGAAGRAHVAQAYDLGRNMDDLAALTRRVAAAHKPA